MTPSGHDADSLALASLDFFGDTDALREQALQELDALGAVPPPDAYQDGVDESGLIRVKVDAHGHVQDVDIAPRWRDGLPVTALPDALLAAYAAAVGNAAAAAALRPLAAAEATSRPTPDGAGKAPPPEPEPLSDPAWMDATWETLDGIGAELDRYMLAHSAPYDERTLTSEDGCFTVHLRGGALTTISGDVRRIAAASSAQLRQEACAVLIAARSGRC